jgi:catechol 2,3-dioxygenase-like lactoylglutathione lyase family enzyme
MWRWRLIVKILGPDSLIFGVDELDACYGYLTDYGLRKVDAAPSGASFEALDGTSIVVRKAADPGLPPPIAAAPNIREQIYGVADQATLEAIGAELSRDREVTQGSDGIVRAHDDTGYPLGFQVTRRRQIAAPKYFNVPGMDSHRPINTLAAVEDAPIPIYSLSHVVLYAPDIERAEKFYSQRLGFRTVDVFTNLGPFMRPAGTLEHHTLFLIKAPKPGVQHFTFHVADLNDMLKAGWNFVKKGYKSFWGPGRHILGSNNFWYFNSPFGGLMEFDSDMDLHDDSWKPRYIPANADTSQTFLFNFAEKWTPGPGRH